MILVLLPLALAIGQDAERAPARPITPLAPLSAPQNWVRRGDYPSLAYSRRAFGMVKFRLDVDGEGKATTCHILNSSGYWMLDEHTCTILLARAKFRPARDANGVGVRASFTSVFWWAHDGVDRQDWLRLVKQITDPLPAKIAVKGLPASYKAPALVRVRFDEAGKPIACKVELTSGNAAIDQVACGQVQSQATPPERAPQIYNRPDTRMYLVAFGAGAPG